MSDFYGGLMARDAELGGLDEFRLITLHKPPSYAVGALMERVIADMQVRAARQLADGGTGLK